MRKSPHETSIGKAARLYLDQARKRIPEKRLGADNTGNRESITIAPVSIRKDSKD